MVAAFARDGAVCVRNAFTPEQVALVREGIERNLADPGPHGQVASAASDRGRFFEDFCRWTQIPEYRRFIECSDAAAYAGTLMGAREVRLYHDHLLVKEPGTQQRTPWHQDQPYYNVDGRLVCSLWMPVDPVARASTLEFVAGSHDGTWYMPKTFLDEQPFGSFAPGTLREVPGVGADGDESRVIGWELQPGDCVFFHMLTLHGAGGTEGSTTRRRAFSLRWLGEDATFAPRAHRTSPPFPGLDDELAPGAPMDHELFPVLWRRA